ncbi:MAG: hypothetical protein ACQESK_02230 [Bacteroidota bacterium]
MKKLYPKIGILLLALGFFTACSSDDDGGSNTSNKNYFPLVVDNEWNYKNTAEEEGQTSESNETYRIANQTESSGNTYYESESIMPDGDVMSATYFLSNGELRKSGGQLIFNGGLDFNSTEEDLAGIFDFELENIVLFDANSAANTVLYTETDQLTETMEGYTITTSYEINSSNGATYDTMEINGEVYEDVISSELSVTLSIDVSVNDFPFPISLLNNEEVFVNTTYYGNEVGIISSTTNFNVQFEDIPSETGIDLPNIDATYSQELENYTIELD